MSDLLRPALLLAGLELIARHVAEVVDGHAAEAGVHVWAWAEAVVPFLLLLGVAEGSALVGFAVGCEGGGGAGGGGGGVAWCGHFDCEGCLSG